MKAVYSLVVLITFTLSLPLLSQSMKQQGVTYRYNGKNPRTPIGGVYIKPITASNGEVSDDNNGTFTLVLSNLKMGDRIGNVRVTKQGMMVFNQQAVDEWSIRKEPLCLILCNADEFQKQKENLIDIGRNEAKKKYDRRLAELKKQNDAQQLKIDEYYNRLDSLEKEYQNSLKHMDEYADVFARIDESEVDSIAQRAIELFNRGEIEESIYMLEQQNYIEKIKQANRTIEHADALISEAGHAKMLAEEDKKKYIEGIRTQIAGYKLKNEWEKAKELLKGLADNLNTLEAIWDYASFCYNQNDFNEAETYYYKLQGVVKSSNDLGESAKIFILSVVQNDLANLYANTLRLKESEQMYKSVLEGIGRLVDINPLLINPFFASIQNNLAIIYMKTNRYAESEALFREALEKREQLAKSNPSAYEADLAQTQNNLGHLYESTRRYSESETMLKLALTTYKRLAASNPSAFEPIVATIQYNLANLYRVVQRFTESEAMFKYTLEIYERLVNANPSAFEFALATVQCDFGMMYKDIQRYSESISLYESALNIFERLARDNPTTFEAELARTQHNLAILYNEMHRYNESEAMYESSSRIYSRLAKDNPDVFEPDFATIQHNIACLYDLTNRYNESEIMYKGALEIRERLAATNPSVFESDLADTMYNLAILYMHTQRFAESEAMCKSALEIYLHLYKCNPQIYEKDLMYCYYRLGNTLLFMKKNDEAKCALKRALDLERNLANKEHKSIRYMCLFELSNIYSAEKDYVSAYISNGELLPMLKDMFMEDSEKYKRDYYGTLVSQSFYSNLLGKFEEGEQYSLEALKEDSTQHIANTNLAAALLFQGKVEEAEKLYRQYKEEFMDGFLEDFAEFERLGIIPEERKTDVERIKAMIKE